MAVGHLNIAFPAPTSTGLKAVVAHHCDSGAKKRSIKPFAFAVEQAGCAASGEHRVKRWVRMHKYFACSRQVLEQTGLQSDLDPAASVAAASIDRGRECGGRCNWARL